MGIDIFFFYQIKSPYGWRIQYFKSIVNKTIEHGSHPYSYHTKKKPKFNFTQNLRQYNH